MPALGSPGEELLKNRCLAMKRSPVSEAERLNRSSSKEREKSGDFECEELQSGFLENH